MSLSNYIKSCDKNVGGNKLLFLAEMRYINDVIITNGEVSEIQLLTGQAFYQIQTDYDSIVRLEDKEGLLPVSYKHQIDFDVSKLSVAVNDLTNNMRWCSSCGLVAIVVDNNNVPWLVGWNYISWHNRGLFLEGAEYNFGSVIETGNLSDFSLVSRNECIDLPLDADLTNYILSRVEASLGIPAVLEFTGVDSITIDRTDITIDSIDVSIDSI